jgi:hypothetical protein
MLTAAKIRFPSFGDRRIAYALSGDGPPLVAAAWWLSHLELEWQDESCRRDWRDARDRARSAGRTSASNSQQI